MRGFREIKNPERRIESMERQIERLSNEMIYQIKNNPSVDTLPDLIDGIDGHEVLVYHKGITDIRIVKIDNPDGTSDYYPEEYYKKNRFLSIRPTTNVDKDELQKRMDDMLNQLLFSDDKEDKNER